MKEDFLTDCPIQNQKDIYFLETNIKTESENLANLFSPSNDTKSTTEMFKYKTRSKLKQKFYPTLEFFVQSTSSTSSIENSRCHDTNDETRDQDIEDDAGPSSPNESRRNSLDLYREAAAIFGLTCQQTDDCKCLECQCHYFDFDEEIDFTSTGGEYLMTSGVSSTCCIQ